MKNCYKIILIGILTISLINISKAQDHIIHNMTNLHQSINNNPARQTNCQIYIGLPIITHTYFDLTVPFTYKKIFTEQADGKYGNIDDIYNNLNEVNYFNFESYLTLLRTGFWVKDYYITAGINNKIYNRTGFPKSIFELKDGNYREDGTPLSFSNFGEDFTAYNEIQLGVSNEIIPDLTVGASVKLLFGLANFTTKTSEIKWYTDTDPEGNFEYTFNTEFDIRSSMPIYWSETYDSETNLPNGIESDTTWNFEENFLDSISQYIFPTQNFGLGFDFGAIYEIDDMFTVSASIIDLGFINWGKNTKTVTQKSEFVFTGADPASYIESFEQMTDSFSVIMDEYLEDFVDTLVGLAKPTFKEESYSTGLNTKIYIGGTYKPLDWLDVGLLYRGYFWDRKLHSSVSFSATANFWYGWSAALSYSIYNKKYNNIGLGFAYKLGPLQFYGMMDNIAFPIYGSNKALQYALKGETKANFATKLLKNTNQATIHFGFNILIGCGSKYDYGLLD